MALLLLLAIDTAYNIEEILRAKVCVRSLLYFYFCFYFVASFSYGISVLGPFLHSSQLHNITCDHLPRNRFSQHSVNILQAWSSIPTIIIIPLDSWYYFKLQSERKGICLQTRSSKYCARLDYQRIDIRLSMFLCCSCWMKIINRPNWNWKRKQKIHIHLCSHMVHGMHRVGHSIVEI